MSPFSMNTSGSEITIFSAMTLGFLNPLLIRDAKTFLFNNL